MGTVYTVPPIPPSEEHTTWVEAGGLLIGVEFRLLDDAELAANYEGEQMEQIQNALKDKPDPVQDNGVSLHVKGADGHEYLRFDMFAREPHYHYIEPSGQKQTIVEYDRIAMGEMLPWTLNQLRTRLGEMMGFAGGTPMVASIDRAALDTALARVEELARKAQDELERAEGIDAR